MTFSFTLDQIAPKEGAKYSPNLHAWMRKNHRRDPNAVRVFRHADGALYVGYHYDGDFIGARLIAILVDGARAETSCYAARAFRPRALVELTDWWPEYVRLGRCHIDPKHNLYFVGRERWHDRGRSRTCVWCGAKQKLVTKKKTVVERTWVPEDRPHTAGGVR